MSLLWILLQFAAGFVLLVAGAEFLVRGASRLASRFNVSPVVIGLTVVAFGTSLPELVVTMTANLSSSQGGQIAIGNIVGSNIANLGLILGLSGLVSVLYVNSQFPKREVPILLAATLIFTFFAMTDGGISQVEGAILLAGLIGFLIFNLRSAQTEAAYRREVTETMEAAESIDSRIGRPSEQIWFDGLSILLGLAGLVIGAQWLVGAAEQIAKQLGVPELIIGLTLVALGTSLPEVATSLVAVFRKQGEIAVGNIVGSNIFNVFAIAGMTALVKPLPAASSLLYGDFAVMILLTVLVLIMVWRRPYDINRLEAGTLLGIYLVYCFYLLARGVG